MMFWEEETAKLLPKKRVRQIFFLFYNKITCNSFISLVFLVVLFVYYGSSFFFFFLEGGGGESAIRH